jgi:hypothetical protein
MYFTVGGIAKEGPKGKVFLEGQAVKVAVKLLHLAGLIFNRVEYKGPVDIATRVSGLKGALSAHIAGAAFRENVVESDEETSDTRAHVAKLIDSPIEVTRSLFGRLVDVSSMGHADEIFEQDVEEN